MHAVRSLFDIILGHLLAHPNLNHLHDSLMTKKLEQAKTLYNDSTREQERAYLDVYPLHSKPKLDFLRLYQAKHVPSSHKYMVNIFRITISQQGH
ncbi:LOW QUALITY PROTEIN: hypothetical protein TorRG33x02_209570 [Trema orientale]|uniref:Uncharacterized protein n=1 Tax=Trema orientale TaxID=63057 RepID=A0A2P5ECJ1_TREOI|nr:LOW QUALITY PROTEIN: hypothetical protein TorRG33x02_209570 [Trema orientale]